LVVCCFGLGFFNTSAAADEILVSAAASLRDALTEVGSAYRSSRKRDVRFNFGASSDLARQIEEGAPADLFFSADLQKMDQLDRKGLIEPGSRQNVLSNQLVIVVALDAKLTLRSPQALALPEIRRIALAQPSSVPAGVYARRYLESEGLWERVKEKIIPTLDVRAALAAVESGNVEAGVVYKTDAAISPKVRVAYEVPVDKGPRIVYPVAIVRESRNKDLAQDFLRFVISQNGQVIFKKFGFLLAGESSRR
jgi:molybdate transport system substrate-binding protein